MKILTVVGARPQFVKATVVSRQLAETGGIVEIILHTGQHYDKNMSDVFFTELRIPEPKYNLAVAGGRHGASTGQMLEKIEEVLLLEQPAALMVYGDTNSTLAGALAARKLNIPVIHIEAGLRSFEMRMPEEINRILTDRVSELLFCPTDTAVKNLKNEGFGQFDATIIQCGDVMQDAAIYFGSIADSESTIIAQMQLGKYVLGTIHRAENTDNIGNLTSIVDAFNEINKTVQVVIPLHPRTRKIITENNIACNFTIIDPVGYLDMIQLIRNAAIIMTDSGGLQKEAFFFGKNCVTLREQTEWVELVDGGFNMIAGTDKNTILNAYSIMTERKPDFNVNLYGNGKASKVIAENILKHFS
jgi:UDP-GlcNAc3NAcA epimerase